MKPYRIDIGGAQLWVRAVGDAVSLTIQTARSTETLLLTRDDACELYGALDVAIDAAQDAAREAA